MALSVLDLNSPFIIESKIRHDPQLIEKLHRFYQTSSPRFEKFHEYLTKGNNSGSGLDAGLHDSYREFSQIIEDHILSLIAEINVSATNFTKSIEFHLNQDNESVINLLKFTYCSNDNHFIDFGHMMELKFFEHYHPQPQPTSSTCIEDHIHIHQPTPASSSSTQLQKHVRVLWDIENIPISKKLGGLNAVTRLHYFLATHALHGPGIDTRITVFFNPEKSKVSSKVVRELDHANVELVWTSTKREDADRKLVNRIQQEVEVLVEPSNTTFVIISSDQDYRSSLQMLTQKGYQTIIIHNATEAAWKKTLEMAAIIAVRWLDIINGTYMKANDSTSSKNDDNNMINTSPYSQDNKTSTIPSPSPQQHGAHQATISHQPSNHSITSSPDVSYNDDKYIMSKQSLGWISARCIRWRGCYGFLLVEKSAVISLVESHPSHIRQDMMSYLYSHNQSSASKAHDHDGSMSMKDDHVRVYCHHRCLKSDGVLGDVKRSLNRGEVVQATIMLGERGLCAIDVIRNQHHHHDTT